MGDNNYNDNQQFYDDYCHSKNDCNKKYICGYKIK